jgi:glycosyltransferase involved in cell wall biosynthesis
MPCAVAVILPTYNRADWIRHAIDSVLDQTFRNYELWVVDDGSTDETADLLLEYGQRIRPIRLDRNLGVSHARNVAIQASDSQWVAFLDSDDRWRPEKLERQMGLAAEKPEANLIHTEEIWIRRGVRVNPMGKHAKSGGDLFRRSLRRCLVSPSSALIRRDVFSEVGLFNESLPACEDYDLWLRILCRHSAHFVSEPLVVKYGGHDDQLSRAVPFLDRYRIRALLDLLTWGDLSERQRQWTFDELTWKCRVFGEGCLKHGREALGKRFIAYPSRFMSDGTPMP